VTEPSRVRRHAPPPKRVRALLVLVTACVLGLAAVGFWLLAAAPERSARVAGQLMILLAGVMMAPVYVLWRSWRRQQRASDPERYR
jgi:hypothetical protein